MGELFKGISIGTQASDDYMRQFWMDLEFLDEHHAQGVLRQNNVPAEDRLYGMCSSEFDCKEGRCRKAAFVSTKSGYGRRTAPGIEIFLLDFTRSQDRYVAQGAWFFIDSLFFSSRLLDSELRDSELATLLDYHAKEQGCFAPLAPKWLPVIKSGRVHLEYSTLRSQN